jgi:hypothetical protein
MSERIEQSFELTASGMRLRRFTLEVARPFVGPATRWGRSQLAASGKSNLAQVLLVRTTDLAVAA